MNIYEAFLKVADLAEREPGRINMTITDKPRNGEGWGCILAWAGFYMGEDFTHADQLLKFTTHDTFNQFMSSLRECEPTLYYGIHKLADGLRAYAHKYLKPGAKVERIIDARVNLRTGLPYNVANIFVNALVQFQEVA